MKRLFDILTSILGLIILSPVLILLAIAIRIDSPGPMFYRGVRVGRYGKTFKIFKFRSMVQNADKMGAQSTSTNDFRLTRLGHFMRKYKFDEFTQFINVLIGDMSIVGPRPEVQKFVDLYTLEEKAILSIRPGITDWASIKFHNEGEIIEASGIKDADKAYTLLIRPEKLRLQLKYVKEHTLWIDFKIIMLTISQLFSTRITGEYMNVSTTQTACSREMNTSSQS